ncbi:hypothetical protein LZ30DRAFT_419770 [Colletotrichum cereale]|nr:hypothetical protein LZ30DRAFT_419770 [Colletotrichum cereale]
MGHNQGTYMYPEPVLPKRTPEANPPEPTPGVSLLSPAIRGSVSPSPQASLLFQCG